MNNPETQAPQPCPGSCPCPPRGARGAGSVDTRAGGSARMDGDLASRQPGPSPAASPPRSFMWSGAVAPGRGAQTQIKIPPHFLGPMPSATSRSAEKNAERLCGGTRVREWNRGLPGPLTAAPHVRSLPPTRFPPAKAQATPAGGATLRTCQSCVCLWLGTVPRMVHLRPGPAGAGSLLFLAQQRGGFPLPGWLGGEEGNDSGKMSLMHGRPQIGTRPVSPRGHPGGPCVLSSLLPPREQADP